MKKIFILLGSMLFLSGCVESVAVMGTGAANGKIVQSSINTGISFGIKSHTGKTPMQHALAYTKKKNIEAKINNCSSSTNKKNLDFCEKEKKRMTFIQTEQKKNKSTNQFSRAFTRSLRSSINENFKIKFLD